MEVKISLLICCTVVSICESYYAPPQNSPAISNLWHGHRRSNSDKCVCFNANDVSDSVVNQLDKTNQGLERLVVYFYREKRSGDTYLYIPNQKKQQIFPSLGYDEGDVLRPITDGYSHIFNSYSNISVDVRKLGIVPDDQKSPSPENTDLNPLSNNPNELKNILSQKENIGPNQDSVTISDSPKNTLHKTSLLHQISPLDALSPSPLPQGNNPQGLLDTRPFGESNLQYPLQNVYENPNYQINSLIKPIPHQTPNLPNTNNPSYRPVFLNTNNVINSNLQIKIPLTPISSPSINYPYPQANFPNRKHPVDPSKPNSYPSPYHQSLQQNAEENTILQINSPATPISSTVIHNPVQKPNWQLDQDSGENSVPQINIPMTPISSPVIDKPKQGDNWSSGYNPLEPNLNDSNIPAYPKNQINSVGNATNSPITPISYNPNDPNVDYDPDYINSKLNDGGKPIPISSPNINKPERLYNDNPEDPSKGNLYNQYPLPIKDINSGLQINSPVTPISLTGVINLKQNRPQDNNPLNSTNDPNISNPSNQFNPNENSFPSINSPMEPLSSLVIKKTYWLNENNPSGTYNPNESNHNEMNISPLQYSKQKQPPVSESQVSEKVPSWNTNSMFNPVKQSGINLSKIVPIQNNIVREKYNPQTIKDPNDPVVLEPQNWQLGTLNGYSNKIKNNPSNIDSRNSLDNTQISSGRNPNDFQPGRNTQTFTDWFQREISQEGPSQNTQVSSNTLKYNIQKSLARYGLYISQNGLLIDSYGDVLNWNVIQLRIILVGEPKEYEKVVNQNNDKTNIEPGRYYRALLISLGTRSSKTILDIIPLGQVEVSGQDNYQIDAARETHVCQTPDCKTVVPVKVPDNTIIPQIQNYMQTQGQPVNRVVAPGRRKLNLKLDPLKGPAKEYYERYKVNGQEKSGRRKMPVLNGRLKKKKKDEDTPSTEAPEKHHDEEVIDWRIIGGAAATSSGAPISSRGRSGFIV